MSGEDRIQEVKVETDRFQELLEMFLPKILNKLIKEGTLRIEAERVFDVSKGKKP